MISVLHYRKGYWWVTAWFIQSRGQQFLYYSCLVFGGSFYFILGQYSSHLDCLLTWSCVFTCIIHLDVQGSFNCSNQQSVNILAITENLSKYVNRKVKKLLTNAVGTCRWTTWAYIGHFCYTANRAQSPYSYTYPKRWFITIPPKY